jgi:spermidine/putrescine transport system permease protein
MGASKDSVSHAFLFPAAIWILFFLIIPSLWILLLSFAKLGPYGSWLWSLTTANFRRALNPFYLPLIMRTASYAFLTTLFCLCLGFPLAYYISFSPPRRRGALTLLLMFPFWTSALVTIYSWLIILGREGLLNEILTRAGLIKTPITFLNTPFSLLIGLVYFYLPFMVMPLATSLEKIPRELLDAAEDLGARPAISFIKITWPLARPGIFAGCLLVFIPALGDFLTAEFLGGPRTYLLGNLIENQFLSAQDWPFGAALTTLLILWLCVGLYFYTDIETKGL